MMALTMMWFTTNQPLNSTSLVSSSSSNTGGSVSFSINALGEDIPQNAKFNIELQCENETVSKAKLSLKKNSTSQKHKAVGKLCDVRINTDRNTVVGDEISFTISEGEHVIARKIIHPGNDSAISTDFYVPEGELSIEVTHEFTDEPLGTNLRVMSWNIWEGGRGTSEEQTIEQIIELIQSEDPDILFVVETYQSGEKILEGLNANLLEDSQYTGTKITRQEVHQPENDNLWIFSRFPMVELYPVIGHPGLMNDFHFGGGRIQLPDGQEVNVFNTWIYHEGWAWDYTNRTVGEIRYGLPRTYTNAEIVATDLVRRIEMIRKILDVNLPTLLMEDESPIIMAGDFNTLSHVDWSERFADTPGHEGLVLQWPVTQLIEEAGFIDTYRFANPDAGRYPGNTWSPYYGHGMAPGRIDYIWTLGEQVRVLNSYTIDKRLPEHANDEHPFYSDHAAVVTDLMIRDVSSESTSTDSYVPQDEITAIASSQHVGYEADKAVDGNLKTMWHSEWDPRDEMPVEITLDLGKSYNITGLDYQTRTDFKPDGIITEYNIYTSLDGKNFTKIMNGIWDMDYALKTINFKAQKARYIKLEALDGSGGVAAAAEINVMFSDE